MISHTFRPPVTTKSAHKCVHFTHLLVVVLVLVVVVRLQCEFCAAMYALEATGMEECEVLERTDTVHLVDDLAAAKTRGFVEIRTVHDDDDDDDGRRRMSQLITVMRGSVAILYYCAHMNTYVVFVRLF